MDDEFGEVPFAFVLIDAMVGDVSELPDELVDFGIVINLEPSLFVYLDVGCGLGIVVGGADCLAVFAGIPIVGTGDGAIVDADTLVSSLANLFCQRNESDIRH
jgi:hypothetical protein